MAARFFARTWLVLPINSKHLLLSQLLEIKEGRLFRNGRLLRIDAKFRAEAVKEYYYQVYKVIFWLNVKKEI